MSASRKEISVGDMAMTVKPRRCCDAIMDLGTIRRVAAIDDRGTTCMVCFTKHEGRTATLEFEDGKIGYRLLSRLTRIDPPQESATEISEKEIQHG